MDLFPKIQETIDGTGQGPIRPVGGEARAEALRKLAARQQEVTGSPMPEGVAKVRDNFVKKTWDPSFGIPGPVDPNKIKIPGLPGTGKMPPMMVPAYGVAPPPDWRLPGGPDSGRPPMMVPAYGIAPPPDFRLPPEGSKLPPMMVPAYGVAPPPDWKWPDLKLPDLTPDDPPFKPIDRKPPMMVPAYGVAPPPEWKLPIDIDPGRSVPMYGVATPPRIELPDGPIAIDPGRSVPLYGVATPPKWELPDIDPGRSVPLYGVSTPPKAIERLLDNLL